MGFYKSFLIGNIVALLILLAIMAVILSNRAKSQTFPATLSACPDFYTMNSQGSCVMEQSMYSSRLPACTTVHPKSMTLLDKKIWASDCGVAWDGITNSSII